VVDAVLALVPAKHRLVQAAARLPPAYRSRLSARTSSAITRASGALPPTLMTNLGIAAGLSIEIPTAQVHAAFSAPDLYVGERASLELAARFCREADAFVDVGANLGFFTFHVRSKTGDGIPIFAYEPDPLLFGLLASNVQRNGLRGVEVHQVAIGAEDGRATFYRNLTDPLSGSVTTEFQTAHDLEAVTVPMKRFSTVARELGFARACVKVDVEHAEDQFLDGLGTDHDRIGWLIMEVLAPAVDRQFVRRAMTRTGWRAYYINDFSLEHSVDGGFRYRESEFNWLFCRQAPAALRASLAGSRFRVHD
jgi:FkbM family methyltransferase